MDKYNLDDTYELKRDLIIEDFEDSGSKIVEYTIPKGTLFKIESTGVDRDYEGYYSYQHVIFKLDSDNIDYVFFNDELDQYVV